MNSSRSKPGTRRRFLEQLGAAGLILAGGKTALAFGSGLPDERPDVSKRTPRADGTLSTELASLKEGWVDVPRSYRPHTRWWWPGSAVTRDEITWELQQMRKQGMGGVEIMVPWKMYAKGNIPYLSDEWLDMVKHAVQKAEELDMEVSISFDPGWSFGGFFVPPMHRSKVLTQAWVDVDGPRVFPGELPQYREPPKLGLSDLSCWAAWLGEGTTEAPSAAYVHRFHPEASDENRIVAVVAGKLVGHRLESESLTDLTCRATTNRLDWQVPEGRWRVMVFRLKYTGQWCQTTDNFTRPEWVVDHLSKEAMASYCDYLGGTLYRAFGQEFGKTLDTLFCDSFEIGVLPQTLLWSSDTLEKFRTYKGYDLARHLPAIWWDIGEPTPRIRYDINEFLNRLGLDTFFKTFIDWSSEHSIQARIQPYYRFVNETIQGAGVTPRPEMEGTTTSFAVLPNPRKAVASGAHLYGRKIASSEAYTDFHRYSTTLEELKIGTDGLLRDGSTQIYNSGYCYSPEMHVAPSRDMPWSARISHWDPWWKYYHCLADYIGRSCFLLRQGSFAADVLIYSPQSTVWTSRVLFGNNPRTMPYGDLPETLVANGYDFDLANDDILQNYARVESGYIKVRDLVYRFLILPKTTAVPLETMVFIQRFAEAGGIVIALEELPASSVGLANYPQNDERVRQIVEELFGANGEGQVLQGGGHTYYLPDYRIEEASSYQVSALSDMPHRALLTVLRKHLAPDFALPGNQPSRGLTFIHRRIKQNDLYFVTNLQARSTNTAVNFRVSGKRPERWDPMTGSITPLHVYRICKTGVEITISLPPYASTFILFRPASSQLHLWETNLAEVRKLSPRQVSGIATQNGVARVAVVRAEGKHQIRQLQVKHLPEPLDLSGTWRLELQGYRFEKLVEGVTQLKSWTEDPRTKHFSGTGRYELKFQVPSRYIARDLETVLDLGAVGNVAEVILNGRNLGVAWMQPYQLEVTTALRSGTNYLEVLVTNTLINYVAGLLKPPDVPADLVPHWGPTSNIYPLGKQVGYKDIGFKPLPPSGLIGPVRILARRRVTIRL